MLERIEFPELFFGLVAPIGVDLSETVIPLKTLLEGFGYEVLPIKVTSLFRDISYCDVELHDKPSEERFKSYIDFGNRLREISGDKAICASLVIDQIAKGRGEDPKTRRHSEKRAYIIHQFKRKEEIDLLRSVYGKLFFQISVYSSKGERTDAFAQRIARDHKSTDLDKYRAIADQLIKLDEDQEEDDNGQRVRDVFHLADFIINIDIPVTQSEQLERFIKLIFGATNLSPTPIEYGMYMAKGASLRSLDLSRQVGAAIFSKRHEVITLGCNEVPKGGGGTYWSDDDGGGDARDFKWGSDPNDEKKRSLILDLFERLSSNGMMEKECVERIDDMLQHSAVKDSQLMDIIEFGRILHAEMSALMDAARLGRPVQDATLFCTTFPCHICAKHIVGAGIDTVYFLEPYPKSAAFALHPDSIEVEGSSRVHYAKYKKTKFTHFFGISPRRYRDFFEKSLRKNKASGRAQEWLGPKNEARPILDVKVAIYLPLEKYVEDALRKSEVLAIEALRTERTVKKVMEDEAAEPRQRKRKAIVRAKRKKGQRSNRR
ncbi:MULTISPECIES: anti-phage dCTP deaminase [unclassified Bradyrhizobium]|uniref:anti-phage dCTP deaminase n=1 Tax=unclassified Bradyrhizobium TaxID=2631580 RepID=UPI00211DC05C|nr:MULTISPECIES: anti-phage dCTP deaminase [unclassified Bradyrhizobium]MDD1533809.1 dCMP deaminase [Bradyrhizobium sp. WBOS8]MDD1584716.1 dCMP deaminase [Bradyrhizobium sp. WBOS4]UUO47765.1 dCMP deaminase [Bradyrhizobium sp. WBOS04]UUO61447.1 dCMP deaminase [Bradyrhizobium sp. WBOS08]